MTESLCESSQGHSVNAGEQPCRALPSVLPVGGGEADKASAPNRTSIERLEMT